MSDVARLFVAVWLPERVATSLGGLSRLEHDAMRWVSPERMHVTLRFLGEANEARAAEALRELRLQAAPVRLGPKVQRLGRSVAMVPASGLDDHAAAVTAATANIGEAPKKRAFLGHVTIARISKRSATVYAAPFEAGFTATEFALVRTEPDGSYSTVRIFESPAA